jgi:hypothetical protein
MTDTYNNSTERPGKPAPWFVAAIAAGTLLGSALGYSTVNYVQNMIEGRRLEHRLADAPMIAVGFYVSESLGRETDVRGNIAVLKALTHFELESAGFDTDRLGQRGIDIVRKHIEKANPGYVWGQDNAHLVVPTLDGDDFYGMPLGNSTTPAIPEDRKLRSSNKSNQVSA